MWHPLRYVLSSQNRLAVSAVLASGVLVAASLWLDLFVSTRSSSTGLNSLLLVLWMFLVLGVSYLEAMFVGDLLFPKGWRGRLMQARGQAPRTRAEEAAELRAAEDEEEDAVALSRRYRSYTVHFSALVALLTVGNLLIVSQIGSGAIGRIEEVQLATALRGGDAEDRIAAIGRVTRLGREEMLVPFGERLVAMMDDADIEVANAAIQGVALVARRMRLSMETLRAAHEPQRWEQGLYQRLQMQWERLLTRFRHQVATRASVAEVLAALGAEANPELGVVPRDALRLFDDYFDQSNGGGHTRAAVVVGAGEIGDLEGLRIAVRALQGEDASLQALGAWALGEILVRYDPERYTREPGCIADAMALAGEALPGLSHEGRCALVEALERVRDGRAGAALFAVFDAEDADRECARREYARRFGRPVVVTKEAKLRMKALRAIAGITAGNPEVLKWLEAKVDEEALEPQMRKELEHMLELARAHRGE